MSGITHMNYSLIYLYINRKQPSSMHSDGPAAPTPTQTNLPLQRGAFILPIGTPQQQNSACLAQNNESAAWTCTTRKPLLLSFLPSPAEQKNFTMMSVDSMSGLKPNAYGIQDPDINPVELTSTVDKEHSSNGPAYYFRTTYSRAVLLREDQIVSQGRPTTPPDAEILNIQVGDRPWLCVFNETLLEGYIYVSQKSTCGNELVEFNSTQPFRLPCLPYVMKLTEQRVPNSTRPYCEQMRMQQNGDLVSVGPSKMLKLSEANLTPLRIAEVVAADMTKGTEGKEQEAPSPNTCRCQWMVQ